MPLTAAQALACFARFDDASLLNALKAIEARAGTDEATPLDDYVAAQGRLDLLTMRRFYEKQLPDEMPAVLKDIDPDAFAEQGIALAKAFARSHPGHSDIERVRGELISTQIRGMMGGMTKGPDAKEAIEKSLELDPDNAWAQFSQARMHYHNPAFAGGDKDKALAELRTLAESIHHFRVSMYLAMTYQAKEMLPQARFWALKAQRAAPDNPEVKHVAEGIARALDEQS